MVLERKTWSDLHASIYKDDRFESQKEKMLRCGLPLKVYLVEGDHVTCGCPKDVPGGRAAYVADLCTRLDELACLRGFHVVLTYNHHKTIVILSQIARLLHAMTSDGRIDEAGCPTLDDFRRTWMANPEGDAASAAAAPPAGGRHREARKAGNFQYGGAQPPPSHALLPHGPSVLLRKVSGHGAPSLPSHRPARPCMQATR